MRPNNKKRELANWIRRRLGEPVTNVLLDSVQLDDVIDQAVDFFGLHAGGIGHEESLLTICPEIVKYDATGTPCQPKPKTGRWRSKPPVELYNVATELNQLNLNKFIPTDVNCLYEGTFPAPCTGSPTTGSPTTGSPTTGSETPSPTSQQPSGTCLSDQVDCSQNVPINTTNPNNQYGGPDSNPKTFFNVDPNCCSEEVQGPGPGWCNTNCQDPHCFTETEFCDKNAEGPYWIEGDTTAPPVLSETNDGFVFKSVYDVPKDVIGILEAHPNGRGYSAMDGWGSQGEALFSPIHLFLNNGGLGLGRGLGYGGGQLDMVGLEMGLQYIEMFRRMYTVRYDVTLLEMQHKVRISPAPRNSGVIGLWVYRKVPDEYLYKHIWVREYAEALAMVQVGMNSIKYSNATFPGGVSINSQFYIDKGEAKREKLEAQMNDGMYAEPPSMFMG